MATPSISTTVAKKQDTFSLDDLSKNYGIAAAVIGSTPDLLQAMYDILGVDAKGNKTGSQITDPNLIAQKIQGTTWYKGQTTKQRSIEQLKLTDPGEYAAALQKQAQTIVRQFHANGIKISAQDALTYAEQALKQSAIVNGKAVTYDQNYLNKLMGNAIDFTKKKTIGNQIVYDLDGKLETLSNTLYKQAYDYGFPSTVSNENFSNWFETTVRGLVSGTLNPEDIDTQLKQRAVSTFPGLAQQIQRGETLRSAADPWLKAIADTWEVDQNSLDLNNDYVQRVLNNQDDKGNVAPMNLYEAKKAARRSSQWDYTSNAKEEKTSIASKLLQDFGFLG